MDDEDIGRVRLETLCRNKAWDFPLNVLTAISLERAFEILASIPVHILLLDKNLDPTNPEEHDGIEAIPEVLRIQPKTQIVMITGSQSPADAALAMRLGAFWYLTKESPDELIREQISKALHVARLARQSSDASETNTLPSRSFASKSPKMKRLIAKIPPVAESERPVLILGETGTGKTTLAGLIHEHRTRFLRQENRPFLEISLSNLNPGTIERELFGSEVGAFTGATKLYQGIIERANTGTLLIDEIGDIPLELQVKLLQVLETGRFYRMGGSREMQSAFKLICATNRDLEAMVARGEFREDLYMRIATFPLEVPSLSERPEDIPEIVRTLLPDVVQKNKVDARFEDIPSDFIKFLSDHPPAGNIRGIEHELSRLLVYAPKDSMNRPYLKGWKRIPGLFRSLHTASNRRGALGLEELMKLPLDVVGSNFPGLDALWKSLSKRIYEDAERKDLRTEEIAKALKVSIGTVSAIKKQAGKLKTHRRPINRRKDGVNGTTLFH